MPIPPTNPIAPVPHRPRALADTIATGTAVLVVAAAGLVLFAAVGSARGRISASTESGASVFSAAQIDLTVDTAHELRFDADALYPGLVVERCLRVALTTSIEDVDVRLVGRRSGTTPGLENFIDTTISVGEGESPDCSDYSPARTVFEGRLDDLWASHSDFSRGVALGESVPSDFQTTVRIAATVIDDNLAQGLTTDFWITFEARP